MQPHTTMRKSKDEAEQAASEALKGAGIGAMKYGIPLLALSFVGLAISPIYRSLTIQFKVFVQMSGMTLGGWIEADRRLRWYEQDMRRRKVMGRDEKVWKKWEGLVEEEEEEVARLKERKGKGEGS
ncbi:hypothetical protein MMC30_004478 [Trapelia coarctata]|nr:hypothetical protein [Trapelia coarctata]